MREVVTGTRAHLHDCGAGIGAEGSEPVADVGENAQVAVGVDGTVYAVSAEDGALRSYGPGDEGATPTPHPDDWEAHAELVYPTAGADAAIVVDTDRNVIVGATFVGQDVADMVHAATIAIVGEVPLSRLWHAVPSYPTISEVWLRLLDQLR